MAQNRPWHIQTLSLVLLLILLFMFSIISVACTSVNGKVPGRETVMDFVEQEVPNEEYILFDVVDEQQDTSAMSRSTVNTTSFQKKISPLLQKRLLALQKYTNQNFNTTIRTS